MIGDHRGEAEALANLGITYQVMGEFEQTLEHLQHTLEIDRTIGNRRGEAGALTIFGLTYNKMGRAKEASTHLMGALDIYTTMGDWKSKALTQIHLAAFKAERNQIQMALRLLQDSYDYFAGQAMPAKAIDVQKMIAEVGREGS